MHHVVVFQNQPSTEVTIMTRNNPLAHAGRISYGVVAWALGAPTIVIIIALIWGGVFKL
jgi:hypothetical protein